MFHCWYVSCFFFIARFPSSLGDRRETLPRDRKCVQFYNLGPKIWGPCQKKIWRPKTCKIWGDFGQLQTSIANICEPDGDIQNRKTNMSTAIPPAFGKKLR